MKKICLLSLFFIAFIPQLSFGGNPADINGDGIVNVTDYLLIISNFNKKTIVGTFSPTDINGDGVTNTGDFLILVSVYGGSSPTLAHAIPPAPTINPSVLTTITGFSATPPPLNTSLAVGTTVGNFNVSESGNASYTIPLIVSPGTAGMAPNLAISYNSQGGDGCLGVGFNLSGLSSITRASQSVYYNNYTGPVNLNNLDNFLLDGNYLIPINGGKNGSPKTVYATESETFVKVISDGTVLTPNIFTVQTKDGKILKYGSSNDAYITASNGRSGDPAIAWLLDTVTDNLGNFMQFSYIQNNLTGEYYVNEINYTGNALADLTPYNKVKFNYVTRPDVNITFINGHQVKHSVLIKSIQMYGDGILMHTYTFNYSQDELNTHLSEIVETGADGKSYNSTKFVWHNNLMVPVTSSNLLGMADDIDPYSSYYRVEDKTGYGIDGLFPRELFNGDFNGDGLTDVVELRDINLFPRPTNNFIKGIRATLYLKNSISNGFLKRGTINYSEGSMNYFAHPVNPYGFKMPFPPSSTIAPLDLNGDGKDDLVLFSQVPESSTSYKEYKQAFKVFLSNGTDFVDTYTFNGKSVGSSDSDKSILFKSTSGDFDGDGITDLLIYYPHPPPNIGGTPHPQMYLFSIKNNIPITVKYNYSNYFEEGDGTKFPDICTDNIYPLDVNGDGRSELMLTSKMNMYLFNLNTDGELIKLSRKNYNDFFSIGVYDHNSSLGYYPAIYPGDFNGDGKTDFLMYFIQPQNLSLSNCRFYANWIMSYSKGDGTFDMMNMENLLSTNIRVPFLYKEGFDPGYDEIIVADFNGDGKADILDKNHSYNYGGAYIYINNVYESGGAAIEDDPFIGVSGTNSSENDGWYKPYSAINLNVYFSKGFAGKTSNNFVKKTFSLSTPNSIGPVNASVLGDFNGDGRTDFVYYGRGVEPTRMFYFDKNYETDNGINKVISITDGLNKTTTLNYNTLPILANSGKYTKGSTAVSPVLDIQTPFYVASHTETDDGIWGKTKTDYSYSGAKFHPFGKGFLGFTGTTINNTTSTTKITNTYEEPLATNFFQTLLHESVTSQTIFNLGVHDKLYTYTTNKLSPVQTNPYIPKYATRYYTYLNQLTDIDLLNADPPGIYNPNDGVPANTTIYTFQQDVYGNTIKQGVANAVLTSNTTNTFENKGAWIPSRFKSTSTTLTRNTPYTRSTTYTNNSLGQPITITSDAGASTNFTYDAYGNILSTTINGITPVRNNINRYDSRGRFVIQQSNALLQYTYATYDNAYGNMLTSNDVNNLQTQYKYDGFGRLKRTSYPGGQRTDVAIQWDNSGLTNSLYKVLTTPDGAPVTITYYDKLGRELRNQVTGFDGTAINTDKIYNNLGQLISTSEPYYNGASPINNFYV
jgi:YD repeat-containing protein